jgi:hypothetical protein
MTVDDLASPAPAPAPRPDGPPNLADPRALQILSTEHWSLLTARSLVYNESFTRGGMFLTVLSASLVALGFVYQGAGAGPDFPMIAIAILALDLFIGVATLGRLIAATTEEITALQATARIRHAYLEMVPSIAPYISTAVHDDIESVLSAYGPSASRERPTVLPVITHGLTTMPGMISVIDATLAGGLAAAVVAALGGDTRLAVLVGVLAAGLAMLALFGVQTRTFTAQGRRFVARFPARQGEG